MLRRINIILISLILSGGSLFAQQSMLQVFQSTWTNSATYTIEVFEAIPENKLDESPGNKGMTPREHAFHIFQHITWVTSNFIVEEDYPFELLNADSLSKPELINLLKKGFEYVSSKSDLITENELQEKLEFKPAGKELSKAQFLYLLLDHTTHHRAQVITSLRKWNLTIPRYKGW